MVDNRSFSGFNDTGDENTKCSDNSKCVTGVVSSAGARIRNLGAGKNFYWKVRANNTGWSRTYSFTTADDTPTPQINSFSPSSLTASNSAQNITLNGSGFTRDTVIRWQNGSASGTLTSSQVSYSSASRLVANFRTTLNGTGTWYFTPSNGDKTGSRASFQVNAPADDTPTPQINSFSPSSLTASNSAQNITLNGSGFTRDTVIRWQNGSASGTLTSSQVSYSSASRLVANFRTTLNGTGTWYFTPSNGDKTGSRASFQVNAPADDTPTPQINSFSPSSLTASNSAQNITLNGSGFTRDTVIRWQNGSASGTLTSSQVSYSSASRLVANFRTTLNGTGTWYFTPSNGDKTGSRASFQVNAPADDTPTPQINSFSPSSLTASNSAQNITLNGSGFTRDTVIRWQNGSASGTLTSSQVSYSSASRLVANFRTTLNGTGTWYFTPSNGDKTGSRASFQVNAPADDTPTPQINSFSPSSLTASNSAQNITLNGSGFTRDTVIRWQNGSASGTLTSSQVSYSSASRLVANFRTTLNGTGTWYFTPSNGDKTGSRASFQVNAPADDTPTPQINSFSPSSLTASNSAQNITLNGSGFTRDTVIRWQNGSASGTLTSSQVSYSSASRLVANFRTTLNGTGTWYFTPSNGDKTGSRASFQVNAPADDTPTPQINSFSPSSLTASNSAQNITLNGSGFTRDTVIRWQNGSASGTLTSSQVSYSSASRLVANFRTTLNGTGTWYFTPSNGDKTGSRASFQVNAPADDTPTPQINSFSPSSLTASNSAQNITLNGSGFTRDTVIRWQNGSASGTLTSSQVSYSSASRLVANFRTTLNGTGTWYFTPSNGDKTGSRASFQVNAPADDTPTPQINSFSPSSLTASNSAQNITLNGSGFTRDTVIRWQNGSASGTLTSSQVSYSSASRLVANFRTTLNGTGTWYFTPSNGDKTGSRASFQVNAPADDTDTPFLSVYKSGEGRIFTTPMGIECGSVCGKFFPKGQRIQLTGTPDNGWEFVRWDGNSNCAANLSCSFDLDDDVEITAVFQQKMSTETTPKLVNFYPKSIELGKTTEIVLEGSNLSAQLVANVQGTQEYCNVLSSSSITVTLTCKPIEAGEKLFYIKDRKGGATISGTRNWRINVTRPANSAPSVWVDDGYKKYTLVNQPYYVTAKSWDAERNLRSIQVDWLANGNWNRTALVDKPSGEDILFSYTPTSTGVLKFRFRATDETNQTTISDTYRIQVQPRPEPIEVASTEEVPPPTGFASGGFTKEKSPEQCVANPITPVNGAKIETRTLLTANGVVPLSFDIHYNSLIRATGSLGVGWDFANAQAARIVEDGEYAVIEWSRNKAHVYTANGDGSYTAQSHACRLDTLTKQDDGLFRVERSDRKVYYFDEFNFLRRVENEIGQGIDYSYNARSQLIKIQEPTSGNYIQYSYDNVGYLQRVSTRGGQSVELRYVDGRLAGIVHADKTVEEFTYTELDQLKTRSLNGKVITTTNYDEFGRASNQDDALTTNSKIAFEYIEGVDTITTKIMDRNSKQKSMIFDEDYKLLKETNAIGEIKAYEYNEDGRPVKITDGNGNVTNVAYNQYGDITRLETPDGAVEIREYDERRNLMKVIDALGQSSAFTYDADNNLLTSQDELGNITRRTYNANNQITSETTPEGRRAQYSYTNGLLTRVTNAAGNSRRLIYDNDGRLTSESDFKNNTTRYELDGLGRKLRETDPLGNRQSWRYDARGNITRYEDANGIKTDYVYNLEGELLTKTITDNTIQSVWRYKYDGESRLIEEIDPNGNTTSFERDELGRVVKVTDALGDTMRYLYDANGNRTQERDAYDQVKVLSYDEMNRVVRQDDALKHQTLFTYDALSRKTVTQDALSRKYESSYDKASRLVSLKHPGDLTAKQGFDNDGQLTSVTTPKNETRNLSLDQNARLNVETTADSVLLQYSYDQNDLVSMMRNGRGQSTTYGYDEASRLTSKQDEVASVSYGYDKNGNVLTVTENSKTIERQFDGFNRVTQYREDTAKENRTRYDFDVAGNLTRISYPHTSDNNGAGFPIDYTYDALNRVKTVSAFKAGLFAANYSYDKKGRIIKMVRGNGTVLTMKYDAADRLIESLDKTADGIVILKQNYAYDALGRLTDESILPESSPPADMLKDFAMTYGLDNRLQSQNGLNYQFDGDGNILAANDNDLTYNARNQLISAGEYSYQYNAEGHRTSYSRTVNGQTRETRFLVSPDNMGLVKVLRMVPETGSTSLDFIYGPNGLVAQYNRGIGHLYFHYDYRGSVRAVTDKDGKVVDRYGYTPYGQRYALDGNAGWDTPFGYNGRDGVITDPNDLIYMRARYYSPALRRFLNKDPLRGDIESLASLNRYAYVGGDPINAVDPSGELVQLQWHTVAGGFQHTLIKITPENQDRFADSNYNFIRNSNGELYLTLGAGPTSRTPAAKLQNGINRPRDISEPKNGTLNLEYGDYDYECEGAFIDALLSNHTSYINRSVTYDLFASNIGNRKWWRPDDGYNSNSYTYTLLRRSNVDNIIVNDPAKVPGWGVYIPDNNYR
ncbi:RHS repeat-associated core domain-containing protein [Fretibacter rubidus]|uniref:RHS repeat-associated core domain-containing protein n=1 Tax=Fretibacter rubidus TaxID=570162 RepID=UPI00352A3EC6